MSNWRILQHLLICYVVVCGGCAQMPVASVPHEELRQRLLQRSNMLSPNSEQLIAINLVDALAQIQGVQPGQVKLNLAGADEAFTQHLYEILSSVGYSVKRDADSNEFVELRVSVTPTRLNSSLSEEQVNTYLVEIGNLKVKRDYTISYGLVIPRSPLFVLGADSSQIALNDAKLFSHATHSQEVVDKDADVIQQTDNVTHSTIPASSHTAGETINTVGASPDSDTNTESTAVNNESDSDVPLLMRTERGTSDTAYHQGEAIVMYARVLQDAQLDCYYQDGDGNVAKIFPNRFTQNNVVAAGQEIRIPATDKWQLLATKSGEKERFLCVLIDIATDGVAELEQIPDLQPLMINDLGQVYQQYSSVVGFDLINQTLEVLVN